MTGVTSFTGCYIARRFIEAGSTVLATLTRDRGDYDADPVLSQRLMFSGVSSFVDNASFGSSEFISAIKTFRPEVIINHGAPIKGYRHSSFDVERCVELSLRNSEKVFDVAQEFTVRVIHSGTIYESQGTRPAVGNYGIAKSKVSAVLQRLAEERGLGFSKILIPNPIGPMENPDRLMPTFVSKWKLGDVPTLFADGLQYDHVPASWLSRFYKEECEVEGGARIVTRSPSAFVSSFKSLVEEAVRNFKERGVDKKLNFITTTVEPSDQLNLLGKEKCIEMQSRQMCEMFWSEWTSFLWGSSF